MADLQPQAQVGGCTSFAPPAVLVHADPAGTSLFPLLHPKALSWVPQETESQATPGGMTREPILGQVKPRGKLKVSTTVHGVG